MRNQTAILCLVCAYLLLGAALANAESGSVPQNPSRAALSTLSGEITEHYQRMLRYHQRMDGNVPDRAVVFIGDSLTQGLCVDAVATPAVNYGIGSDTSLGVLQRLPKYASLARASVVVVAIGINDMKYRDNDAIIENYSKIFSSIPRSAGVVVSAVLPVDETRVASIVQETVTNRRIRALNEGLAALCRRQADRECVFIDSGRRLVNREGQLEVALSDPDGVHLNSAGNALWIADLKAAVVSLR